MKTLFRLLIYLSLVAESAYAATEPWPQYQPTQTTSGVVRLSGNSEMKALVLRWTSGFQKYHPSVRFETHLTGTDTGMAALYTSKADLALLGRAPTANEIQAFEWVFRYKPAQVEVMTGSLNQAGKSPALVVFVHHDNPLKRLTVAQLEAIYGTEHQLSSGNIRTWGELGLSGEWANKPINLYLPDAMSGTGRFFRHVVLNDSRMMNWAQLTEFHDTSVVGRETHDAGHQIISALAQDRFGMAIGSLDSANEKVRPVALSASDSTDQLDATRENLISRKYPLSRVVLACYNRKPGTPVDPAVREFLLYVLSREGQQEIPQVGSYLPLTAANSADQSRKLD
ncbi:MAG TPA: substrate-binding domain-containing protein [Opitutaceae bacterium]|nr:substrate-binding domain-containing protein [Opitutaceae bacterium]